MKDLKNMTKKELIRLIEEMQVTRDDLAEKQRIFIQQKDMQINKLEAVVGVGATDAIEANELRRHVIELKGIVRNQNGLIRYAIELRDCPQD